MELWALTWTSAASKEGRDPMVSVVPEDWANVTPDKKAKRLT
jgi:hypothetical protein